MLCYKFKKTKTVTGLSTTRLDIYVIKNEMEIMIRAEENWVNHSRGKGSSNFMTLTKSAFG